MPPTRHAGSEPLALLGGRSPEAFLREHWQTRPLLVRQALPGFASPIDPEELAGLACEEEVESRLVLERGGSGPWEVRHGPFDEHDFTALPETHWTLLVQEADRHLPAAARLLRRFRFIPDWRRDDVMISFAPAHGSVGPHLDSYDVFLVQAQGRRRWSIACSSGTDTRLVPGLEIGVLADFRAEQEWVLEPGDLLYLPPGVAHHGVALEDCQTWSVGFRAPRADELLGASAEVLAGRDREAPRYADPDLAVAERPAEITPAALARARRALEASLDEDTLARAFGRLVTEGHSGLAPEPPATVLEARELRDLFQALGELRRSPRARFAYLHRPEHTLLFVSGEAYDLDPEVREAAGLICDGPSLRYRDLAPLLERAGLEELLLGLYHRGELRCTDD